MSAQFVIWIYYYWLMKSAVPRLLTHGTIVVVLLLWRIADWPIRCQETFVGARHAVPAQANEPLSLRLPAWLTH
jgi:hypothetical protein